MKRLIIYLVGLFIMAFGVSASIISNLGVSPIDTIPYVTSEILKIDMGICTTAIFTCYVLLQMLLLGRQFPKRNILQIAVSAVSGGLSALRTAWQLRSFRKLPDMESSYSMLCSVWRFWDLEFFCTWRRISCHCPQKGLPRRWRSGRNGRCPRRKSF